MRIGITEAGDAGRDLSWFNKAMNDPAIDGVILITKSGQDLNFQSTAMFFNENKPVIIHFTVTGWGSSDMEPNVKGVDTVLMSVRHFIDCGFPADRVVLRIDPIIPTDDGIVRTKNVLYRWKSYLSDVSRIRISIYDDYYHSHNEMLRRGYPPVDMFTTYESSKLRRPTTEQVATVASALMEAAPGQTFECCAEPELVAYNPDVFKNVGCVSARDLNIMNIDVPTNVSINGQKRFGCSCLTVKRELLSNKKRCENNCAYCYWGR